MEAKKKTSKRYSAEVRERAIRLLREALKDHDSEWAAIQSIASKIGCTSETLRGWLRQAERDGGERDGMTTEDRARMKALEREVRELKQANEILRKASAYFAQVRPAGRSSTARSANDCLHSRTSWRARGRADLQTIADRPVQLSCPQGAAARS